MSAAVTTSRDSAIARAAVISRPQQTSYEAIVVRSPRADEVRVRLEGCGICASNLPVWEGRPWFQYPLPAGAPGHEGWGIVDAVGADVTDLAPGDRVAMISANAYAELDIAPRSAVIPLPAELAGLPFPGEPLGCAMNIFERSDISVGQQVLVIGAGFLGLLVTQLAIGAGAQVCVLSRRSYALDFARQAGAECYACDTGSTAARDQALAMVGGKGYARVIETGGLQSTLDLATALTAEYGRLVIAGYHQDGPRQVDMQTWNWRCLEVINAHERSVERYAAGVRKAVGAVLDGTLNPFPLLTHRVPLHALSTGLELMRTRPDGYIKAIVDFEADA